MKKKLFLLLPLLLLALALLLTACGPLDQGDSGQQYQAAPEETALEETAPPEQNGGDIQEDGYYYDPESVGAYLHAFGHLPDNYLTKAEAEALGWDNSKGNLWEVAPGCCIGGDRFGNREGLLPNASGRKYYECDVNYAGGFRGGERIVWSSDGLIFYTADHYASYTQLY